MSQELGRVQRPPVDQYKDKRKLLLVPLIQSHPSIDDAGATIISTYWAQVTTQLEVMQTQLGAISVVYCENLAEGGDQGLEQLQAADQSTYELVSTVVSEGATLEVIEELESLSELIDLQRFLASPMVSQKVATRLQEWYTEASKSRWDRISETIGGTLGEGSVGLILASERHQIQFPSDIEVFYVAPPALDEFRRWMQDWIEQRQREFADRMASEASDSPDADT